MAIALCACLAFSCVHLSGFSYEVEAFNQKSGYVTGEEVNVRTGAGTSNPVICTLKKGHEVTVVGDAIAPNGVTWYNIEFVLDGENKSGYMSSAYIRTILPNVDASEDTQYEEYLDSQQFPESYRVYLRALHKAHPKWTFVALPTGLEWSAVVEEETKVGANLIPVSSISSWKSLESGAYDWETGTWLGKDGDSWVSASPSIVKYYLDPRNFLRENNEILQFQSLRYIEGEQTIEGIANILKGTFMDNDTYYNIFMEAGKLSGVNPYHLASRCRQEVGVNGSNSTFDIKDEQYSEFNGYYNYFNIGASPSAEHNSMYNGLARAKSEGWDSPEKAIKGGAAFLAEKYINVLQDTLYLQKFDVVDGGNEYYWHQYMTNLQAASSESNLMKKAYSDLDEASVTFYVPVYLNMPQYSFDMPEYDGSVNCVLSGLSVEGYEFTREFDPYVTEYTINGTVDADKINIIANAYAADSSVSGTGEFVCEYGVNEIKIICTGADNSSLTYTINFENTNSSFLEKGDVNKDRRINVSDARVILEHVVEISAISDEDFEIADVNEDGVIDVLDALEIMKIVLGESEGV